MSPLTVACAAGHADVVRLLLSKGAEVEAPTKARVIAFACPVSHFSLGIAQNGGTPLSWAIAKGHVGVAELLLSRGANISASTRDGLTPLHLAAAARP